MDPASSSSVGTNAPLGPGAEPINYQLLQLTQVLKDLSDKTVAKEQTLLHILLLTPA